MCMPCGNLILPFYLLLFVINKNNNEKLPMSLHCLCKLKKLFSEQVAGVNLLGLRCEYVLNRLINGLDIYPLLIRSRYMPPPIHLYLESRYLDYSDKNSKHKINMQNLSPFGIKKPTFPVCF